MARAMQYPFVYNELLDKEVTMTITKAIITAAILTIASTSFAGSKCTHMMTSQGNSLFANTTAPSSIQAQGTQTATSNNQAIK